jgi:hypothetical protein
MTCEDRVIYHVLTMLGHIRFLCSLSSDEFVLKGCQCGERLRLKNYRRKSGGKLEEVLRKWVPKEREVNRRREVCEWEG